MAGLKELQLEYPVLGGVRGRGLMIGTEFTSSDGQPNAETCKRVHQACFGAKPLAADLRNIQQRHPLDSTASRER